MVTGAGTYPFELGDNDVGNAQDAVLRDMTFDPVRPGFVIATGISGVFFTQNRHNWEPLLRSTAMSITPTSLFYDWLSCERSVYVGTGQPWPAAAASVAAGLGVPEGEPAGRRGPDHAAARARPGNRATARRTISPTPR